MRKGGPLMLTEFLLKNKKEILAMTEKKSVELRRVISLVKAVFSKSLYQRSPRELFFVLSKTMSMEGSPQTLSNPPPGTERAGLAKRSI